jgi:hypothetical protein
MYNFHRQGEKESREREKETAAFCGGAGREF